jgi:CheY-specific phosphatase CheX
MKKILLLLVSVFFTLSTYGQSEINYSPVYTVTKVGDTLTMKFQYNKGDGADLTLAQFDFEYNNKLLTYISSTSQAPTGASYARNNWTGYKFNPKSNSDEDDMDVQYVWWKDEAGNASYSTSADWSVERITIQTSAAYVDGNEFIKYQWRIKDKFNSGYDNYNNIIKVNWANYQQSNGTQIQTIKSPSTQSLTGIEGGNAGTFTINLKTANSVKTDYSYTIKNGAGESVATGDFDESGQASISGLENNVTYTAEANLKEDATYLDQVVTVSDLALVFAEAIGAGSGPSGGSSTFDYHIQDLMGDVVGSDNGVDFQDSYEILAYLQGVTTNNSNLITKDGQTEDYSGIESTYGSYVNNTLGFAKSFTPLDSDVSTKTIDLAHGLRGDVNFSHSWEPSVSSGEKATSAQSSQARMSMAAGSKFSNPEDANIDLISFINDDGLVVFEIKSDVEGMVGSQFNIVYDPNVIELSNVIFDTGNTMTNFSNVIQNGLVRVGSFDQEFTTTVKQGTPYKLVFTPLETIENTSGLISFRVKEGVKADGTQINFIIQ